MARKKKLTPEMQQDLFGDEPAEEQAPEAPKEEHKSAEKPEPVQELVEVDGELFGDLEEAPAAEEPKPEQAAKAEEPAAQETAVAEPETEASEEAKAEAAETAEEGTDAEAAEEPAPVRKSRTDVVEEALSLQEERSDELTLAHFASKAYLEYAISVVKGRALPDLCDGQKPVQRRILYAMHRMGLTPQAKQVKSARVVGDVLGKYHPHGDSAAYEAMVRMAQDFTMRYPLVDGHGNFGSRDGDGAAAMRYTEAKLTRYAELLLSELDEGTVNYIPNYDGAFKEPVVLPSRMPFVLLNGASGIAVGMATEIPTHNMREVAEASAAFIENPDLTLDEALAIMPGPDLPGGAQIISPRKEIEDVYRTGYGSLQMRATYHFEELARGQWQLVVTQLPYKVSTQKILSEIETITNPKPASGKKTLSAKQNQEKMLMLNVLDKARDESDKEIDVRLVFEPRSKTVNREEFANILFAKTSLEFGCKFNLISIGIDGKPRQKGLLDVLREWSEFRIKTVKRRCAYRLQAIEDRIEVLEGRLLVLLSIDEVIRIIRESDDPKTELQTRFNLSERQVEDILEIKLRQLAKLEDLKLRKELEEKEKERNKLRTLLDNDKKLRALVVDELRSDAKKYGDERRTLIKEAESAVVAKKIVDEPTTVVISQKGFIRARAAHNIDAKSLSFKLGDGYLADFECRSVDYLVLLSNLGRAYSIPVSDLPNARGDGTHISAFVQFTEGERPAAWFAGAGSTPLLIASNNAMGFLCKAENLVVRQKAGKTFFDMDKGAAVLAMTPLKENLKLLAGLSESGRLVVFAIDEIGERSSGGKGVLLMDLAKGEKLIAALPCTENGIIVCGVGRGNKAQELSIGPRLIEEYRCRRARKGKNVQAKWKFTGLLPGKADQKTSDGVLIE